MFRKLKIEWFYMRRMFESYGLKPVYWFRYCKNKFFGLQLLAKAPAWHCGKTDDFEVHILSPKNGLWMAYWTVRSFLFFSRLCPKIILHSDGSIDNRSAELIESKFSNLKVLHKEKADKIINSDTDIPAIIKKMRSGKNVLIMMFLDHYLLSRTDKVLVLDNDLIFWNNPAEIIDFMSGAVDLDAMIQRDHNVVGLDVKKEYAERHKLLEKGAQYMNSGIILFKKGKMPIERIVEYFENTEKPEGHFIEQAGWASMICQTNFKFLPEDTYATKRGVDEKTVAKHYTSPIRHKMFAEGIDLIKIIIKKHENLG